MTEWVGMSILAASTVPSAFVGAAAGKLYARGWRWAGRLILGTWCLGIVLFCAYCVWSSWRTVE